MTAAPTVVEICAGGGGQALGLEQASFEHAAVAEIDPDACSTLRANRPGWKVIEGDIRDLDGRQFDGVDLVAGGVPCQPFSVGGMQLGAGDERDVFPEALRLIREARPRAVMLENVPGLGQKRFNDYRWQIVKRLDELGYKDLWWLVARAEQYGVPQRRHRLVLVTFRMHDDALRFSFPFGTNAYSGSVGRVLHDLMGARKWEGTYDWTLQAAKLAPAIVGGSKKHGGPDLGPTRAREAWRKLGVNGGSIAEEAPGPDDPPDLVPRLTNRMVARIQGFPDGWQFSGRKTAAYRQIGNALPPPVARAFGESIAAALRG
ncbi:MAG: modification methylase [Actinomycetia bacterium]|nr:modification methylase [Actinomycetes bacterium]